MHVRVARVHGLWVACAQRSSEAAVFRLDCTYIPHDFMVGAAAFSGPGADSFTKELRKSFGGRLQAHWGAHPTSNKSQSVSGQS